MHKKVVVMVIRHPTGVDVKFYMNLQACNVWPVREIRHVIRNNPNSCQTLCYAEAVDMSQATDRIRQGYQVPISS